MASPLISLEYQKINDNICIITQSEETYNGAPNSDLELDAYKEDTMITAFHFLCELLEKSNLSCEMINIVRHDLQLAPDQLISQNYMTYDVVNKYVQDIEVIRYSTAECYLTDLPISEEVRENLKSDIISANVHGSSNVLEADLYEIYDDLDGNSLFGIKIMRNLERLEKYMTWEQIMEIRPGYTFKLILKHDYLQNIESIRRIESALDTWICNWLNN